MIKPLPAAQVAASVDTRRENVSVEFKHTADRINLHFGCDLRSHLQVRLEPNGEVYLSHCKEARRFDDPDPSGAVPFDLFEREFRTFIRCVCAMAKEAAR